MRKPSTYLIVGLAFIAVGSYYIFQNQTGEGLSTGHGVLSGVFIALGGLYLGLAWKRRNRS